MKADKKEFKIDLRPVCIEVSADCIKIAQFCIVKKRRMLVKLDVLRYSATNDLLVGEIKDLIKARGYSTADVVLMLARDMVTLRMLELPSTDRREVLDMVELQKGRQTPHSEEDVSTSVWIMGASTEGYSKVMMAVARKDVVRRYQSLFEAAGFDISRVTVSSEGLMNWLGASGVESSDQSVAVLDVNTAASDFSLFSGGCIGFSRTIRISLEDLSSDSGAAKLASEIRSSLDASKSNVSMLVITGAVLAAGFEKALEVATGLKCRVVESASIAATAPGHKVDIARDASSCSLTALLGMGSGELPDGIDLTLETSLLKQSIARKSEVLWKMAVILLLFLSSVSMFVSAKAVGLIRDKERLEAELASAKDAVEDLGRAKDLISVVNDRTGSASRAIVIMSTLPALVPEGVTLSSMEINADDGIVTLAGSAAGSKGGRQLISDLKKNINASALFDESRDEADIKLDPKSEIERYDFVVSFRVEKI